ncbi:MAG: TauD/TfdA dioxygenase family protein [Burkholderiales bacterium]
MEVRPISHALGAEVLGVDLRREVGADVFAGIHQAFLDSGILLFRNQALTREQHIAFSRRFGELDDNDRSPDTDPKYPELTIVTTRPKADGKPSESRYTGQVWHSDLCFSLSPAMGSLLRCVELPGVGGDTMFANMYRAYDTLSDGMKKLIGSLDGIHARQRKFTDVSPERAEFLKRQRPVAQPVVRVHPETGRKTLYLGEKVKQFVGMTPEESQPLIDYLNKHSTRPQFVYRHQWRKDDLVLWDNRCTMHLAVGDFDDTRIRHMERTTVKGTPSGYVYEGALN